MRRNYPDQGWLARVPRRVHEFAVAERDATDRLVVRLCRQPTTQELASEMRIDLDVVLEAQEVLYARNTRSLEAAGPYGQFPYEQLGAEDGRLAASEDREAPVEAISTLDGRPSPASSASLRWVAAVPLSRWVVAVLFERFMMTSWWVDLCGPHRDPGGRGHYRAI